MLPVFGIADDHVASLALKGHADHRTVNDVIRHFGSQLGFNMQTTGCRPIHCEGPLRGRGEGQPASRDSVAAAAQQIAPPVSKPQQAQVAEGCPARRCSRRWRR